jgi:hypothetical protein
MADIPNPLGPTSLLKRPLGQDIVPPVETVLPENSVATKAEKVERIGLVGANGDHIHGSEAAEPESKRIKLDNDKSEAESQSLDTRDKLKGVALIKKEYVVKLLFL